MTAPAARTHIPTSLVGSYAQPTWLLDRDKLRSRFPPRVRARELWRVDPAWIEEAQDDATRLAILDQERAGLDVITDGEMRRESYSNRFATALDGVDIDNPGTALDRSGHPNPVPRVVGPVARRHPVQVRDAQFLKAHTSRTTKMTVPGPFTMSQQAQDDHYGDPAALGMAYARGRPGGDPRPVRGRRRRRPDRRALHAGAPRAGPRVRARRAEARDRRHRRHDRGAHLLRLRGDHPRAPEAYSFLPELAGTEIDQVSIETAQSGLDLAVLDALPDRTIILGVLDLSTEQVETPELVAERIARAFPHTGAGRLIAAPDCGMKYLPRDAAYGKLEALVEGARLAALSQTVPA